jgi:hypothetical protein
MAKAWFSGRRDPETLTWPPAGSQVARRLLEHVSDNKVVQLFKDRQQLYWRATVW